MVNHRYMRLGKKTAVHDPRSLRLAAYLPAALPAAPPACDWGKPISSWPMMLNDTLGCCTCAAAGHLIQAWTADAAGVPLVLPDDAILAAYEAVGGYQPGHPATDEGAVELDVLKYWRNVGIGEHKIDGFTVVDHRNGDHVKTGVFLFGGLYIGVALPLSAQDQDIWDVPAGGAVGNAKPGSWGGHAIPITAYDGGGLTCITWGEPKRMTWDFFDAYCDEAYGVLGPDWFSSKGEAPSGFNLDQLAADLKALH